MTRTTAKPVRRPHSVKAGSASARAARKSATLFARAQAVIPGGVNSPVRAFKAVGGTPRFIASAKGATITDVDGHTYIDYVMSWGPLIHGHAPRGLLKALASTAAKGTSFGAPTALETRLAAIDRLMLSALDLGRRRFGPAGTDTLASCGTCTTRKEYEP